MTTARLVRAPQRQRRAASCAQTKHSQPQTRVGWDSVRRGVTRLLGAVSPLVSRARRWIQHGMRVFSRRAAFLLEAARSKEDRKEREEEEQEQHAQHEQLMVEEAADVRRHSFSVALTDFLRPMFHVSAGAGVRHSPSPLLPCSGRIGALPKDVFLCSVAFYLDTHDLARLQCCSRAAKNLVKEFLGIFVGNMFSDLELGSVYDRARFRLPEQGFVPCAHAAVCLGGLMEHQPTANPNYLAELHSPAVLGEREYLTEHMRASVVDWMVEVALEYGFNPAVLHSSVQTLDLCLGATTVPRSRFQLLGCVCLMLESRRFHPERMSEDSVMFMCDGQYTREDIAQAVRLVQQNVYQPAGIQTLYTAHASTLTFLAAFCQILEYELVFYQALEADLPSCEDVLLSVFFADLSLLDYALMRFSPFTIACSVMFLTRMTLTTWAEAQLYLTPFGPVRARSREALSLIENKRLYLPLKHYQRTPFGVPWLRDFIISNPAEARAVAMCIPRLWKLHRDYYWHMYNKNIPVDPFPQGAPAITPAAMSSSSRKVGRTHSSPTAVRTPAARSTDARPLAAPSTPGSSSSSSSSSNGSRQLLSEYFEPCILSHHPHMLAGFKEKYHPPGSLRDGVWSQLSPTPAYEVAAYLEQVLGDAAVGAWDAL